MKTRLLAALLVILSMVPMVSTLAPAQAAPASRLAPVSSPEKSTVTLPEDGSAAFSSPTGQYIDSNSYGPIPGQPLIATASTDVTVVGAVSYQIGYQHTISPLQKGALCSSVYTLTNQGSATANVAHDFYDENDQHVYGPLVDTISAGASKVYALHSIPQLAVGYTGYVIVSADQPFTYTLYTCPEEPALPTLYPISNPGCAGNYTVDWSDVSAATSYTLQEDDNAAFSSPTTVYAGSASQYAVTGQAAGMWYYRVRASSAGGDSNWSNTEWVIVFSSGYKHTISPLQKGDLCSSVYTLTNQGSATANVAHDFYDENDQHVYGPLVDTISAGASKVYALHSIPQLTVGYTGYAIVSADQPFTYTLYTCPEEPAPPICSADCWCWQNPLPQGNPLLDVSFTNARIGWAVGGYGIILHTTDGGSTWNARSSGTTNTLHGVVFANAQTGWVVGTNGTILYTANGGNTWSAQASGTTNHLFDVAFTDAQTGWAVGDNGTILHTTNGGSTWSTQAGGTTNALWSVAFANDQTGWVVGDNGTILHTTNGGSIWSIQSSGTINLLEDVTFINAQIGWAVGWYGTILQTTNGGSTWNLQPSGITSWLSGVFFIDAQTGWAVGSGGTTLRTTNGGSTWNTQPSGTTDWLVDVVFIGAQTGWAVGRNGNILYTMNGGSTWGTQSSGATTTLRGVIFTDAQVGWVVGDNGTILHTTNGGISWGFQSSGTTNQLEDVAFINVQTGWAVGYAGTILHTTNGGNTWNVQSSGTTNWLYSVFFIDAQTGWVVGSGGTILHTTDGGSTWSPQSSGTWNDLFDVAFTGAQIGWAVGNQGIILHTTNGGTIWSAQSSGTTNTLLGVSFTNAQTGWAVGSDDTILHTTNGGSMWIAQSSGITGDALYSVCFTDAQTGWAVGSSLISHINLLHTTDGGSTWIAQASGTGNALMDVTFTDAGNGWVVGLGGTILHYSPCTTPPAPPTLYPISNPDGDGAYTVDWSDVSGAITYTLQEDDNAAFSSPLSRYVGSASQYAVTGQITGTWYYRVRASNANGDSDWSNTESVTVSGQQSVYTLILVNRQKLAELYGETEAASVMTKLNALAAHANVQGLVVQVENDPTVAAAYAARGSDYNNKNKANAVAGAIRQVILTHWSAHPELKYLVVVGDDRVIPFYRTIDGTDYPDTWTLTDDFYADRHPTPCAGCANTYLYIPDLAGGRLVETPAQINGQIDTFLTNPGLSLSSAVVTGYDFVIDGAEAHCSTLQDDNLTTDCTLIGSSWTKSQFVSKVLQTHHEVTSINAHANEEGFGTPSHEFISVSEFTGTPIDFSRAIFYTVGCHSGYNVSHKLDLPEGLAIKKANYVANTGYGWGGYGVVLSEELMWNLTRQLVAGTQATPGQALMQAKQQYYADHPDPNAHDEKITTESTLYGLPMYVLTSPTSFLSAGSADIRASYTVTSLGNGLRKVSVSYSWPMPTPVSSPAGTYYTLDGAVFGQDGEPVLPRFSRDVSESGYALHGVVLSGASYTTVSTEPAIQRIVTTSVTAAPVAQGFSAPDWYPATFFTHNIVELESANREALVAAAGQYNPNLTTNRQRVYTGMSFDIYYHDSSTDWTVPSITSMRSALAGGTTTVRVVASDPSGIQAVVIAYTANNGIWNSASLTKNGSAWTGSFSASSATRFLIQVVDGAGNVTVDDHEGVYYQPGDCSRSCIYLPLVLRSYTPSPPATGPDLTILSLTTVPASPAAGQQVEIRAVVKNQGPAATGWFYVDLYVDPASPPSSPTNLGAYYVTCGGLGPGEIYTAVFHHTFTSGGAHTLYVQADTEGATGHVAESNEGNNIYGPVTVNVSGIGLEGVGAPEPGEPPGPRPTPTSTPTPAH